MAVAKAAGTVDSVNFTRDKTSLLNLGSKDTTVDRVAVRPAMGKRERSERKQRKKRNERTFVDQKTEDRGYREAENWLTNEREIEGKEPRPTWVVVHA